VKYGLIGHAQSDTEVMPGVYQVSCEYFYLMSCSLHLQKLCYKV